MFLAITDLQLQAIDQENEVDTEEIENNLNEGEAISYYFNSGYEYNEILSFLERYHGLTMSYSTLLRRLRQLGLRRRCNRATDEFRTKVAKVRQRIVEIMNGPEA